MAEGDKAGAASPAAQALGEYLANLRTARKFSLRDVQEASGVSNAYLSQLEHGRIKKPSPWILKNLADLFGVSYDSLMGKAGYHSEEPQRGRSKRGRAVVAAGKHSVLGDLNQAEEEKLLEYLAFIRSRQSKS